MGEDASWPLSFAVIADPTENIDEDGARDYEIFETDIHGVMRDGLFVCPFNEYEELEDFLKSLLEYIAKMRDGSLEMMEVLEDDFDS